MNKVLTTVAIIVGLLVAGISAQAGIFGVRSHAPTFAERWAPVDGALHSGTFVVKGDDAVF